ncbi:MAG: hypothetical protein KME25_04505 [Symplocastrum torsivum CPER-KK1]|uniref:Uncharacterized protein n=1 Tax=Symplocastrum torsivum CPER-KK1 TaxID=450513 RepID=A0A951PJC7_9CYAN|nr:hypothetical protein [Symplocastrum torsivum CPER-KK1]
MERKLSDRIINRVTSGCSCQLNQNLANGGLGVDKPRTLIGTDISRQCRVLRFNWASG